jgi:molybdenum cofactor cytidylyltransferase
MASGQSLRFGENKLIKPLCGRPLIEYIIEKISSFSEVPAVVVTRWPAIPPIAERYGIPVILHEYPLVNDTIRLGTEYFMQYKKPPLGIMYCVADQPLIRLSTLRELFEKFAGHPDSILRLGGPGKDGKERFSNPVIFPQSVYDELCTLPQGKTGKFVIQKHSEIVETLRTGDYAEFLDADTEQEFAEIEQNCRLQQY